MRIIAIDPGYERIGIAVMEKGGERHRVLYSECFTTPAGAAFYERLGMVDAEVERILCEFSPQALAAETLFFNTNQKTAFAVAEARGAIIVCAVRKGMTIYEYSPLQVKSAMTGYGRATKNQIIDMVRRLSDIGDGKRTDDEYDAIAVGITCLVSEHLKLL